MDAVLGKLLNGTIGTEYYRPIDEIVQSMFSVRYTGTDTDIVLYERTTGREQTHLAKIKVGGSSTLLLRTYTGSSSVLPFRYSTDGGATYQNSTSMGDYYGAVLTIPQNGTIDIYISVDGTGTARFRLVGTPLVNPLDFLYEAPTN